MFSEAVEIFDFGKRFVRLLYHKCEAESVAERYDTMFSEAVKIFDFGKRFVRLLYHMRNYNSI